MKNMVNKSLNIRLSLIVKLLLSAILVCTLCFVTACSSNNNETYEEKFYRYNQTLIDSSHTYQSLLIGDSYFDHLREHNYCGCDIDKILPDCANIGVGGTTFGDWVYFIGKLNLTSSPKQIWINLGFNDIHMGKSFDEITTNSDMLLSLLKNKFPDSKIYILTIVHSPAFKDCYDIEQNLNNYFLSQADTLEITVVDVAAQINKDNYFRKDKIHLNKTGYQKYLNTIKDFIN